MSPLEFIAFAVVVTLVYYLVPRQAQGAVLLAANIFYCLSTGLFCLISVISVGLSAFCTSRAIERSRNRRTLIIGLLMTLSSLVFSKLLSASAGMSVLSYGGGAAAGVAFYSLSAASYLIDVYRGKIKSEVSFWQFFLFVGFFPCMRLGPILRYGQIAPSLRSPHAPSWNNIVMGAIGILWGYFKKLVIADTAIVAVKTIAADPQRYNGGYIFFLIILYSVVIYADFTGGVDIAVGVGRLLDISVPKNFDRPFSSRSVREYWRRWHMSLGAWFSDYVFYPLSVSRAMRALSRRLRRCRHGRICKNLPVYIAVFVTWLLTGMWHGMGLNFILWGAANSAVIIVAQEISPLSARLAARYPAIRSNNLWGALCSARTFFIIGAIRLFDLWGDALTVPRALLSMLVDSGGWADMLGGGIVSLGLSVAEWVMLAFGIAVIILVSRIDISDRGKMRRAILERPLAATLCMVALIVLTVIFGAYGVEYDESSFIYSQF